MTGRQPAPSRASTPAAPAVAPSAAHDGRGARRALRSALIGLSGPLAALLALVALVALTTPHFLDLSMHDGRWTGAIVDILQNGAPTLLVAVGMTFVVAAGGIDLSVGSIMALAATVAALLLRDGGSTTVAVAAGLGAGLAAGLANGAMVCALRLPPIVATLVSLVAVRGVAQALTHDQKVPIASTSFARLTDGTLAGIPTPIVVALAAAGAAALLLRTTVAGLYVEAIGVNERAAQLSGLPVAGVRVATYACSGLLAGVAGLLAAADIGEADVASCGRSIELDAILAVAIGGTALAGGAPRLAGSLIGALFMRTLTVALLMHGVVTEHTLLVKGAAAVAVCSLQSPAMLAWRRARSGRP